MTHHQAFVLRDLGERARHNHDLAAAQEHYRQAVDLLRTSEDRLALAHTIRHLGDVHAEQQHWIEADLCFVEALHIYRLHPAPRPLDLANAIRSHAALKSDTGHLDEARLLWAEAHDIYQSEGIASGVEECRQRG